MRSATEVAIELGAKEAIKNHIQTSKSADTETTALMEWTRASKHG